MKKALLLLAAWSLAACSQMPTQPSSFSGQVQHPDVFHSYIN